MHRETIRHPAVYAAGQLPGQGLDRYGIPSSAGSRRENRSRRAGRGDALREPSFSGCHYRTDARSGRRPLCEGDRHLRRRAKRNPYGLLRPQLSDPLRLPIGTPARPHRRHLYAHGRLSGTNLHGRNDRSPCGNCAPNRSATRSSRCKPSSTILRPRTPTSPSAARRIPAPTPLH